MKKSSILWVSGLLLLSAFWFSTGGVTESLHFTRNGKATWYAKENGGFYNLTDIPMSELSCEGCHSSTGQRADGSTIDPATYEPGCTDCHNFADGNTVKQETCLNCHGRQNAEINLANAGKPFSPMFRDVHRDDYSMVCTDCHKKAEFHEEEDNLASMFEPSASATACEDCHSDDLTANETHIRHVDNVECKACHSQTVLACYNCHFETEIEIDKKRFYGPPPLGGFVLLARNQESGKVTTASFQSVTYEDQTFYAVGPFTAHTTAKEARECVDCHDSENMRTLTDTGELEFIKWNDTDKRLVVNTTGVIPMSAKWEEELVLDFVRYTGNASDPIDPALDPTKWEFMKTGADLAQMMYLEPLSEDQMAKLKQSVVTAVEGEPEVAQGFRLEPNYPNPFNPSTTIEFYLDHAAEVSVKVYNLLGAEMMTVVPQQMMESGMHQVAIRADGLASGVYLYALEAGNQKLTRTMTLLK